MPDKRVMEKPVTLSVLINFFDKIVEPRFIKLMDERFLASESRMNQRFDDLYRKYERLEQEYVVISHQLKRCDQLFEKLTSEISEIKSRLSRIEQKLTPPPTLPLERKLMDAELEGIKQELAALKERVQHLEHK